MAKASAVPGLTPTTRFADAAAAAVEMRTVEVFARVDSVLDTQAIENVHAMRVATRRLRAALEVFAACFPAKAHRRALSDVKHLAAALGARRDPDVAIAALNAARNALRAADAPGIESLEGELRADQIRANARLRDALRRVREARLEQRLTDLVRAARSPQLTEAGA